MQPVTLEPIEAIALAAAGMLGALEEGQPTDDSADEAERLRQDAIGVLSGSGMSPRDVIELAKRVAREASSQ